MARLGFWAATAATAALLAGGGLASPAYADTPTQPEVDTIHLRYAGDASTVTVTDAGTVAEAITQLGLEVDGDDRVSPARTTAVTDGMTLTVDVVSVKTSTRQETVAYKTVKKKTKKLMKGQKKTVRKGHKGKVTITSTTTTVNGEATTVETTVVNKKVRDKVVKVGTSKLDLRRWKKWNRIARCESGGRWHINTHNGYYGGLQFNLSTWKSAGGRKFAKYPNHASKREQIHVANTLYAKRGFSPWSCKP